MKKLVLTLTVAFACIFTSCDNDTSEVENLEPEATVNLLEKLKENGEAATNSSSSQNFVFYMKGANGKYVSLKSNNTVKCDVTTPGPNERWEVVNSTGGTFALRGNNGKYLSRNGNGNRAMKCDRTRIGSWEKWNLIINATRLDYVHSFEATNGKFINFNISPMRTNLTSNLTYGAQFEIVDP